MNVRLTASDMECVQTVQAHFERLEPIPVPLAPPDVVRIALRELKKQIRGSGVDSLPAQPNAAASPRGR